MAHAVVTGGTGFVGANLVRRLAGEGHDVHLLVRRGYSDWRIRAMAHQIHLHEVELTNGDLLLDVMRTIGPEWVFHLAVYGAYPSQTDVGTMVQTNIVGTLNVVQASLRAGARVVVNTGSSSEYGFKNRPADELEPAEPNSPYAVTKLAATQLCRHMAQQNGARVCTLRLYSVYGPFEEPTRLIPTLLVAGLKRSLPRLADPRTGRDFVYVDDVVDAYLSAAASATMESGTIFNVGTGVQTSIADVVELVREMMRIDEEPRWGSYPDRAWDTPCWVADSTRIQAALGWFPRYTLDRGLAEFTRWLAGSPQHLERYRAAQSAGVR
jgi:nucleoside-diphosphate-sugar epimerase